MSVMMSVMKRSTGAGKASKSRGSRRAAARTALPKVFSVRDMNRNTSTVLDAVREHGFVTIRSRSGEVFRIQPETEKLAGSQPDFAERMRVHRERMTALGYVEPTMFGWDVISKAIAGEM
jgi:antitoxin (DNA-binding transcriptional repressor) of toxin-antitoxin stability system